MQKIREISMLDKDTPDLSDVQSNKLASTDLKGESPVASELNKPGPLKGKPENTVVIGGKDVEIKPVKFLYIRNQFCTAYTYLKKVPMATFLLLPEGTISETRSGDQIVFDFLVAVFDDEDLVANNFNDIDQELFDRILEIYGRINKVEVQQENDSKNPEAQMSL